MYGILFQFKKKIIEGQSRKYPTKMVRSSRLKLVRTEKLTVTAKKRLRDVVTKYIM